MMTTNTTYTLTSSIFGKGMQLKFAPEVPNPNCVTITYTTAFGHDELQVHRMPLDGSYWSFGTGMSLWSVDTARKVWSDLIAAGWRVQP